MKVGVWIRPRRGGVRAGTSALLRCSLSGGRPSRFYNRLVQDSMPMIATYGRDALIGTKLPYRLVGVFLLVLAWGNQQE